MIKLVVSKNDSAQTLLNFLKKIFKNESLAKIYHLFYQKKIRINGQKINNYKYKVSENDVIIIYDQLLTYKIRTFTSIADPGPKLMRHYEDENMVIVEKPHNLVVHSPTLLSLDNVVRYYFQQNHPTIINNNDTFTVSHLYRLDKLTAGLIIYPKNKQTYDLLQQAQTAKIIKKYYYAVVSGVYQCHEWKTITGFISKDEVQQRMIFTLVKTFASKPCTTLIRAIYYNSTYSIIECQLVTGRKHQIRATLRFLGYQIVGDQKYDAAIFFPDKIMLFAYKIKFNNMIAPLDYLSQQIFTMKNLLTKLISFINFDLQKNGKIIKSKK